MRETTLLAAAATVSGLLAYVFLSLATRTLGAAATAPVSVLWTYWAASAAVLTFPIQHWIARTVATDHGEESVRRALPKVAMAVVVAAAAAGLGSWFLRAPLFHREDAAFPALVALVTVGSGFIGVVRGQLSARHRFHALGWALAGENGVRCLCAAALAVAGMNAPAAFGLALALGPLAGIAWPSSFRFSKRGAPSTDESPLSFLGGVAGGTLLSQLVLTAGPVLLSLMGGSPADVTALFAGLALFRAPFIVGTALVSQVTGRLTVLVVQGRRDLLRRIRALLVVGAVGSAALGAAFGAAAGPEMVRIIFGAGVRLSPPTAALIVAGSALALANLLASVGLIAHARGGAVLGCWTIACVAGAVPLLADGDVLTRVVVAFVVAESVAFAAMVVDDSRQLRRASDADQASPGPMPDAV